MQVSDWWMFLSFYQNVLAVPLAIVLLVLLVRARTKRRRMLYGALILVAFLPHIQLFVGNYYFDYLCRTQAGEFIYRTVDNVEGILQMRPRDGSKDYFDRMRAGDVPEDPWGHTNAEARHPDRLFVNTSTKYDYLEVPSGHDSGSVTRYFGYNHRTREKMRSEQSVPRLSKYGFRWFETTTLARYLFQIHGGTIEVVDLATKEVLGLKKGYVRLYPYRICPNDKTEELSYAFVSKVAKPKSITTKQTSR